MQLHEIIRRVIKNNPRSAKQIGINLGRTEFTVLKWGESPDESGSPIPGTMIIPFSNYTQDFGIVKFLANECGFSLIKVPSRKKARIKDITRETAKNMKEFSEFINKVSSSLEDGEISESEAEAIRKEGMEAAEQILYLCEVIKK